jgi:MoxR-like ATPase
MDPEEKLPASGTAAPARADHAQAPPVLLEVSPFSLAERTAFIGRESEGDTIRAVIDRALTGHGSIVMLWDGPGVGKSRLAMEMAEYASRWLPMLRRALLRKRRTLSLSSLRRDY